jgi:hypothetical protein
MKVVVQNGAAHGLSRRDVEAVIPLFPSAWSTAVQQITLYQGREQKVSVSFYPKQQILGLFWPAEASSVPKAEALRELLLALSVVSDRGELPARLPASVRERHNAATGELYAKCLEALSRDAA